MSIAPQGLPRILAGLDDTGAPIGLVAHERLHGPLPQPPDLIALVERSGLRGRGGADFPTAIKLRSVAGKRNPHLIVNGSETEPASGKDVLLLERLPHLVLDGATLAAETIGAREVIVVVREDAAAAVQSLENAIEERRGVIDLAIRLHLGPGGYVSGEETAVVNSVGGGPAKPTIVPPRPFEKGLRGRPTLIQNAETLAQMALIARHGAAWFREIGTHDDPGSVLCTISGAVRYPGVYELAFGTPIAELIEAAGGVGEPLQAVLVGGYFGSWVPADAAGRLRLARADLKAAGCSLGAGIIVALGESACGLHESARIATWLAGQSAGQCGPCVYGLEAIAGSMVRLARGGAQRGEVEQLRRWCSDVRGRGACHHPNGVIRFVESALTTFAHEIPHHNQNRCGRRPVGLPLGPERAESGRSL
jgi:NADH:ubiquinone oxidoreductase subunit F (NADH-binding)